MNIFTKKFWRISPFWQLAAVLVFLPVVELFVALTFFGKWITIISVIVGGFIGLAILQREGIRHWRELNRQLDRNESPTLPVLNGILLILGAILMIVPGLITDLIALILLFPLTRAFFVSYLQLRFESYRLHHQHHSPSSPEQDSVIDID